VLTRIQSDTEEGLFGEEDMHEITNKALLLKDRAKEIKRAARSYVRTVSQFNHIKRQRARLDPQDFIEKIEEIDRRRRVLHDGLIESLTVYTKVMHELSEYGFLDDVKVLLWSQSEPFEVPEENTVVIFSPEILNNRELVKDWA